MRFRFFWFLIRVLVVLHSQFCPSDMRLTLYAYQGPVSTAASLDPCMPMTASHRFSYSDRCFRYRVFWFRWEMLSDLDDFDFWVLFSWFLGLDLMISMLSGDGFFRIFWHFMISMLSGGGFFRIFGHLCVLSWCVRCLTPLWVPLRMAWLD